MQRYKIVYNGYILGIGFNCDCGIPITKSEYRKISAALAKAPEVGENQVAYLRDKDLVWEIIDVEPSPEEE